MSNSKKKNCKSGEQEELKGSCLLASSTSTTPHALFLLGLRLLTTQQRDHLCKYLALTDYGTRYIPPEKQPHLLTQLAQLAEEENLDELDFFAKLRWFQERRGSLVKNGSPSCALFQ